MSDQSEVRQWTRQSMLDFLNTNAQKLYNMGVRKLGLFGSYARDEAHPESDVDLLVVLEKSTFESYFGTKFFLEDNLGREVDLVEEKMLKPRLSSSILKDVVYVEGLDRLS